MLPKMNQTLKTPNLLRCFIASRHLINNQHLINQQQLNKQQIRTITRGRVRVLREMKIRSRYFDLNPHKLRHRREWLDWNYDCEIYAFNQRLKESFDEQTLKQAFIFKSYYHDKEEYSMDSLEEKIEFEHNEEFINDGFALCNQFLSKYLRYFLRNLPEEGISAIKNYLLTDDPLSEMASRIGCNDLILCKEFPVAKETLAKTMLSLIGALKHDTNEKQAIKFIIDFVLTYLYSLDLMDIWQIENPDKILKTILSTNKLDNSKFEYRLLRETGSNTIIPSYLIGFYCNQKLLGFGPGSSIEEAKEMAAYDCLRRMFNLNVANMVYEFGEKAYDLDFDQFQTPFQSIDSFKIEQLNRFK